MLDATFMAPNFDLRPEWLDERVELAQRRRVREAYELARSRLVRATPEGRRLIEPILGGSAERLFAIPNSTVATTAAPVKQPTGSAIRTMLQIECGAAINLGFVEWGISLDGTTSTNVPGQVELFTTTVAATMSTASASTDVTLYGDIGGIGTQITFTGTGHTGFATAAVTEGTVANYRMGDIQIINPTVSYVKQWPLGREFVCPASKFTRVRVTFANTVNAYIYAIWAE